MNGVTQPERGRGTMLSVVMAAAALIALLAFAPFASAASDPLASGTTTLTLNKGFFKQAQEERREGAEGESRNGERPHRDAAGQAAARSTRPPAGHRERERWHQVQARQEAGAAQEPDLRHTTKNFLTGKVGKKQMKIATVSGLSSTRNGFGVDVSVKSLKLTGKAAKQLNKKLGFSTRAGPRERPTSSADSASPFKSEPGDGRLVEHDPAEHGDGPGPEQRHSRSEPANLRQIRHARESTRSPASRRSAPREEKGAFPAIFFTFPITGGIARARRQLRNREQRRWHSDHQSTGGNTVQFTNLSLDFAAEDGAGRQHGQRRADGTCLDRRSRHVGSDDYVRLQRKDDHRHGSWW